MITLEHVNKYFNKGKRNEIHVIDDTTLTLKDNGLVALLGPSGSGKTTLLNVIGGLDHIKKGKIFVNNQKISKKSASKIDKIRNLNMGYIFQDYKLIDDLSVFDNVALVLKMIGIKDKEEIKTRVNYVLDTLNIYRYRNRPAGMLSGGERQRVGIARAIVKDPDIILADEPTGNLDSKNSLELMNIIKCISKNRLVILVTHEEELARFFASRIIEIQDGKIVKDYENTNSEELDYRLENNIYLKDIKYHNLLSSKQENIDIYNESNEKVNLKVVVRNGNIYIKSEDDTKIEVIDNNSSIELINDHYKKLDQNAVSKYEFNFDKVINNNYKKRYSSILNPVTLITTGFKKVFNYSFVKKLLLLGFIAASMFITYSFSRIFATLNVKDSDFITYNKSYLKIDSNKFKVDNYLNYEQVKDINYVIPGDSMVSFGIKYNDYLQTTDATETISGSLASIDLITKDDLVYGKMPENDNEIVIDTTVLSNLYTEEQLPIQTGYYTKKDLIGHEILLKNMKPFKLVGVSDAGSPSIYASKNILINIISNKMDADSYYGESDEAITYLDYTLSDYTLKKGTLPVNDYEVVINNNFKDQYSLNKTIETKINNHKLKVVGYYETAEETNTMLVNNNMIKYNLVLDSNSVMVSSSNKENAIKNYNEMDVNAKDAFEEAKRQYMKSNNDGFKSVIIASIVMISISLIEMFLMMRSSFLSRIKEIGTYRAIGVKKKDIYKMFLGEIFAITFTASLLGTALMGYIIYNLTKVPLIGRLFLFKWWILLLSFGLCLLFNILVGLIPVANVIRKTPAQILSRHDI